MSRLLTPEDVAEMLGVSRRTVTRMAAAGELPAVRIGSQWRFREQTVRAWVVDREAAADWERAHTDTSATQAFGAPAEESHASPRVRSLPVGGLPRDYAPVFSALWGETASIAASPAAARGRSTRTRKRAT